MKIKINITLWYLTYTFKQTSHVKIISNFLSHENTTFITFPPYFITLFVILIVQDFLMYFSGTS